MSPFLGEFVGTAIMVLLGNGVVANVLLAKSKGQNSGWIVIATGWAFAVMVGVFAAGAFGSSDAHLNPAVSVWDAIVTSNYTKLPIYLPAQFLGAFVGAILVWLQYLPHWKETPEAGFKLACFSTAPAIRNTVGNVISEVIGTVILLVGIGGIFAKSGQPLAGGLGPFLVGALVWGIGLSLGGPTGYAINPARDLAPRLAHAVLPIAGKGDSDWSYAWIPVVAPLIGSVIAAVIFRAIAS